MKAVKDANWRCAGLFCLFLAMLNLVIYVVFGTPLPGPRSTTARKRVWPLLGSVILFFIGFIGIAIWFALFLIRQSQN